jgi:hypothetical protein
VIHGHTKVKFVKKGQSDFAKQHTSFRSECLHYYGGEENGGIGKYNFFVMATG